MSVSLGMILFGALLIYGGWKNLSISSLARGDNATPKAPLTKAAGT